VASAGSRFAWAATKAKKWVVSVGGKDGAEYDGILAGSPVFSADGAHVAYAAKAGTKWVVVLDEKATAPYDGVIVGGPSFTADGGLEFLAFRQGKLLRVTCTP